jgi:TfoX/Sxy family transcriptional regulator of competence genes
MTMKWRKSPETLVQKFAELVPLDPRVERRKMFGYPAAFVAGNLFMGLHQEALILRLSDDDRESFLKIDGASVFEPMPGRPMREYVVVPSPMVDRETSLAGWIRRSLEYATAIPSKNTGRSKGSAKKRPPAKRGGAKDRRG